MEDAAEIIQEFLQESREGLDRLEDGLINYEKNPADANQLSALFRVLHTLKGTAGFLGFSRLEKLAHGGEGVLSQMRDGKIRMTPALATLLLELTDLLRLGLRPIESGAGEEKADDSAFLKRLQAAGEAPAEPGDDGERSSAPVSSERKEDNGLRVSIGLLDQLMNLTGEMVLARNRVFQFAAAQTDPAFNAVLQPLNQLTLKLQEGVLKARLQPLSHLWGRFPRLARDTAKACGKQAVLEMEGEDIEIDRGVLEMIRDPLTHLVRNAIDHGLESPDERLKAGKSAEGRISLKAFHEAGAVQLEIKDDGAGLGLDKIKRKALRDGLITADQAEQIDPDNLAQFIFRPGFSTAEKLTSISGRGVGLDVVKANLEKIGGKVEVQSLPGQGTSFKLKIPLTLTTLPALVAHCDGRPYILPRAHVEEIIRIQDSYIHRGIEYLPEAPVYRLRGKLLPLIFLRQELKAGGSEELSAFNIVVLRVEERLLGLVVDSVADFQEVVVKPLGRHFKSIPLYAGSTILGDGQVALIMDVPGLAKRCRVLSAQSESQAFTPKKIGPEILTDKTQLAILFQTPDDGRMALSLEKVLRLETFQPGAVEKSGGLEVIQYGGKILPLVYVSRMLPERRQINRNASDRDLEKIQVVVYDNGREEVGLVVDRVLDIVKAPLEVQRPPARALVKGSMILKERITELLDVPALLAAAGIGKDVPIGA